MQGQHATNRATAARFGWTVVHEFTDNDKSAAKSNVVRDEFEAMVRACGPASCLTAGPFKGSSWWRMTGWHGGRATTSASLRRSPTGTAGCSPTSASRRTSSEDVKSIGLIGAVIAKAEVRKMQRRMRNDHRRRALAGEPPAGGNRPLGWYEDHRTLHPVEAPVLRRAAEEFAAGRGVNSIVAQWVREGRKTTTGRPWTTTSLKVLLKKPPPVRMADDQRRIRARPGQ